MFRKTIAATCLFAALGLAAPASADGYRHGHWGGHDRYYGNRHYRHDGPALFAGGLLLGALIGQIATSPRTVYVAPPPQPVWRDCRTIYGTGYLNGRLAKYSGTGCYDAYGDLYAMPGSERFLGYLN